MTSYYRALNAIPREAIQPRRRPRAGMSGAPWEKPWFSAAKPARRKLWRGVEAQHRVATMRLVDNLAEQSQLEQLFEAIKHREKAFYSSHFRTGYLRQNSAAAFYRNR